MPNMWLRNATAEAIGAFALVFVSVLAGAIGGNTAGALATGLIVVVMVAALGHVSGGHFNPAITLGMYLGRRIDLPGAVLYWVAQLVGATFAALVLWWTFQREVAAMGAPQLVEVSAFGGVVLEGIATFFLVLVVFGTVVDTKAPLSVYPFAIGLTITAGVFAIGPFTGGALNPARGFGPALISGEWDALVAWSVGPLAGGVLAWVVWEFVIGRDEPMPELAHAAEPSHPATVVTGEEAGKS